MGGNGMRRKDREITDTAEMLDIIENCNVMRLCMCDGNKPYAVPMNFGFDYYDNSWTFYFHCANEGRKLDIISRNSNVFLEADCSHRLTEAETACGYGYDYRSIMAEGTAVIVTDTEEKKYALSRLMKKQTGKDFSFTDEQVKGVTVIKVNVSSITGKKRNTSK